MQFFSVFDKLVQLLWFSWDLFKVLGANTGSVLHLLFIIYQAHSLYRLTAYLDLL